MICCLLEVGGHRRCLGGVAGRSGSWNKDDSRICCMDWFSSVGEASSLLGYEVKVMVIVLVRGHVLELPLTSQDWRDCLSTGLGYVEMSSYPADSSSVWHLRPPPISET